jgi:hypothetical protein
LKYTLIFLALDLLACIVIFAPVEAAVTSITLNPISGQVGNSVTINVSSGATDSVSFYFDSTLLSTMTATAASWTTIITIPAAIAGSHLITAVGPGSSTATATLNIVPKINLSKTTGSSGNSVTITGTGFAASSNVKITFNGAQVSAGNSDATGNLLSASFNVPLAASGTYTVAAIDGSSNTASAVFTNTVTPTISLNQPNGNVGTSITVTGSGFASNESGVQVTLNNSQLGSPVTAVSNGTWSITAAIPAIPAGSYPIGASGNATTAASVTPQTFKVTPNFTLGKTTGTPGASIAISGTGFAANETNIVLSFDGHNIGSPVTADANGSWTSSFNVPVSASGTHNVVASGPTTAASSITAILFTVGPNISENKTTGAIGVSVIATGSGFASGENGIVITFDGAQVNSPVIADTNGSWSSTFVVPASIGGIHNVSAKGAATTATFVSSLTFTILPSISLNKTSGAALSSITVNGTGFTADEQNIALTYDGIPVNTSATINADTNGSWSATFTVPESTAGTHTITAKGPISGNVNISGNQNFQIASSITLSSPTGYVGSSVNVTGSGFMSDSALAFYYDGALIDNFQAVTDGSGDFRASLKIPKSKAGDHTIKISDGSNTISSATFSVDSTPPPVPNPTSPPDGSKIGLTGNVTPTFKWSSVIDTNYTSGIIYNFQIDTDPAFPHPLLQETALTGTRYTLMNTEALPRGQYYWRIQAVDPASNASSWSQAMVVNSGIMSTGLLTLLIILVILVILIAIYILLLRPAMKKRSSLVAQLAEHEIGISDMVNAEFRIIDTEDTTRRKALPWRLALPQATQSVKEGKTFSPERQARLKVVIDFAKALPLIECGNNTNWLIELAENDSGETASPVLYAQLLKNEIQLRYDPSWIRHPTYNDLHDLLEGQFVLLDLNDYIYSVNRTASDAVQLLQTVYKDITGEITSDILVNGGWGFISSVYNDSISWFLGKYLREPSEKDYVIKQETDVAEGTNKFGLYGTPNTPFEGLLALTFVVQDAEQLRGLHLKLRRTYRNSDLSKQMANLLTKLEVQRARLLTSFSHLGQINP